MSNNRCGLYISFINCTSSKEVEKIFYKIATGKYTRLNKEVKCNKSKY